MIDKVGGHEKYRRHAGLAQYRPGQSIIVFIAVIKSDDDRTASGLIQRCKRHAIGMTPKPFYLTTKIRYPGAEQARVGQ